MKVYVVAEGDYSGACIVQQVFTNKEHAAAYAQAHHLEPGDVHEHDLQEQPVEVREYYYGSWDTSHEAGRGIHSVMRDFDGQADRIVAAWHQWGVGNLRLAVEGWDFDRVREVANSEWIRWQRGELDMGDEERLEVQLGG